MNNSEGQIIARLKNLYTGEMPLVYHETGSPEKRAAKGAPNFLPPLVDHILSQPKKQIGCPQDLTIVTWNNYSDESILEQTCAHLGIPVKVYGKNVSHWTSNYEQKIKLMLEACRDTSTKYILGVDSRDLVFLASPKNILDEFKKMNCKLLFGGTIKTSGFYKDSPDLLSLFKTLPGGNKSIFRNLNGGQWLAETSFATEFFENALTYPPRPEKPESDQIILAHTLCYNLDFRKYTKIDYACRIFQIYTNVVPLVFFYDNDRGFITQFVERINAHATYYKYMIRNSQYYKNSHKRIKSCIKNFKKFLGRLSN